MRARSRGGRGCGCGCGCVGGCGGVPVSADQDDRQGRPARAEHVEQVEPRHARHPHVGNEARGTRDAGEAQELLRGRARDDFVSGGCEEPPERAPHRHVVIDDDHHCVGEIRIDQRYRRLLRCRRSGANPKRIATDGRHRQLYDERGTLAFARTAGRGSPAVQLDDAFCNRKSEAESPMLARTGSVCLAEALENVRQKIRVYADPCVNDADLDLRVDSPQYDLDATASRRELYGVGNEIPYDLLQTIHISAHRPGGRVQDRLDPLRRPIRLPHDFDVHVFHALERPDFTINVVGDHRARRAPRRRERHRHFDVAVLDLHVIDQTKVHDVEIELGVLHSAKDLADGFRGERGFGHVDATLVAMGAMGQRSGVTLLRTAQFRRAAIHAYNLRATGRTPGTA